MNFFPWLEPGFAAQSQSFNAARGRDPSNHPPELVLTCNRRGPFTVFLAGVCSASGFFEFLAFGSRLNEWKSRARKPKSRE